MQNNLTFFFVYVSVAITLVRKLIVYFCFMDLWHKYASYLYTSNVLFISKISLVLPFDLHLLLIIVQ